VLVKFPGVERLTGWENVLGIVQAHLRDILEPAAGYWCGASHSQCDIKLSLIVGIYSALNTAWVSNTCKFCLLSGEAFFKIF
jgi:hypothetical protein